MFATNAWPRLLYRQRAAGLGVSLALHMSALALLTAMTPALTLPTGDAPLEIVAVPPSSVPADEALVPEVDDVDDAAAPDIDLRDDLALPGFEYDIEKVRVRKHALFPFITDGLPFLDALRRDGDARETGLLSPFPQTRPSSGKPPLTIGNDELRQLVDSTWSRRDRWRSFEPIARLIAEHDPDAGRAPELVRSYLDQNLLQPYYDSATRDPRYWVMLGLAADHGPMIEFIGRYVRRYPGTRTSTELLFLLDEFAQGSRDALLMMEATSPDLDLQDTRASSPDAYALALELQQYYATVLRQGAGGDNPRDIRRLYDVLRLRILTTIVETSPDGYGTGDARFLLGRIYWDRNDVKTALHWWRGITPDGRGMYALVAGEIQRGIARGSGGMASTIIVALAGEYQRWLQFSRARLKEFGYAFDTF